MSAVWSVVTSLILMACSATAMADMITIPATHVDADGIRVHENGAFADIFAFGADDAHAMFIHNWPQPLLLMPDATDELMSVHNLASLMHVMLDTAGAHAQSPVSVSSQEVDGAIEPFELDGLGTLSMLDMDMVQDSRWFQLEGPMGGEADLGYSVAIVPLPPGLLMGIVGLAGAAIWRRRLLG